MAFTTYGNDACIAMFASDAGDLYGGSASGSTSSTTPVTVATYSPTAPSATTDYLLIATFWMYHNNTAGRGIIDIYQDAVLLDQVMITPASSSVAEYRAVMYVGKVTVTSGGSTFSAKWSVSDASHTLTIDATYGAGGGFILFPWESFLDPNIYEYNGTRGLPGAGGYPTTYTDFTSNGTLTFTPSAPGPYLVIAYAAMAGGTSPTPIAVALNIDGTTKMEAHHYTLASLTARDQHAYAWASIETFDATSHVLKFQGKRDNTTVNNSAFLYHQAIFAGSIAGRLAGTRGVAGSRDRIVTAAHPGRFL